MTEIKYKKGDIIEATEVLIAHGCNAQGVMGSGVAKEIRAKWPLAFTAYKDFYDSRGLMLGDVIIVNIDNEDKIIANCITQEFYGLDGTKYVDYNSIKMAMNKVVSYCEINNIQSFAIPRIGAGYGGGDWSEIKKILQSSIEDSNIDIIVYEL